MKKKNFKVKKFDESEKAHEVKRDDLITQYKRMTYIACDIYDSDFFAMATKKEQKEIEASIARISKTLISMIGMEAIKNSHDRLPDDSGNGNDHSWDNLPDDSDGDEVNDYSEVNLGNFIVGSSYGQQYLDICRQYGFDAAETLKQFEKVASLYDIQMISLVDVVDSQDEITADKYTLEPGSIFFVTNKNDESRSPVFMLIYAQPYTKVRSSDISKFSFEIAPAEVEESTKTNDIKFINSDAYFNIGKVHLHPNTVIDLDATLEKIKDEARVYGIGTITFVDTINFGRSTDIYSKEYTLEPGSLFCHRGNGWLNFMLIVKDEDTPDMLRFIWPVEKPEENTNLDDIEFIGIYAYYNIDNMNPNYTIIDLDATLAVIKERARAKNIKTITFVGIIKGIHEACYEGNNSKVGSLYYLKNDEQPMFILITGNMDFVNLPEYEYIDPVVIKKDGPEGESDSKEDGIKAVEAEDKETAAIDPRKSLGCKSSIIGHCINDQYANVDTSEMSCDDYAKVSFPIFMKHTTMSGKNVSFVDICNIYNFDVSETIKRIKNVAYRAEVGGIIYVDIIDSIYEVFRETANGEYLYDNGSLFLMTNCANAENSPYFVILRKVWDINVSQYIFAPYRVNPIMKSAKINSVEEIDVIDDYADGNVRIGEKLDNIISICFDYKIRKICNERNYDYDNMISCIMGVIAIIGGGSDATFEGEVDSINSIISVDPMVAYNTCSIFFVNDFVSDEKKPYFVIYMPITGKTKSGHNFRLYRIYPIPKQDPNTNSKDDSNVREINQFTSIYLANSEVNGPDKDVYMKNVELSDIIYSDEVNQSFANQSFANICNDWKFNGYDTIKRIKLVAYRNNLKEIKFAGTVCSHEEISEKKVLYDYGSVLFVSDAEDPHFVTIEYIGGVTWMNRINPVEE